MQPEIIEPYYREPALIKEEKEPLSEKVKRGIVIIVSILVVLYTLRWILENIL